MGFSTMVTKLAGLPGLREIRKALTSTPFVQTHLVLTTLFSLLSERADKPFFEKRGIAGSYNQE